MLTLHPRSLRSLFASLLFLMPAAALASTSLWQGPYAGVYLGGGFGDNRISTSVGGVTSTSYFTTAADINAVNNAGSWTKNPDTLIGGLQAGHDWAWKEMVYGLALDYGVLPMSSSRTTSNTYPDSSDQYSIDTSMQTSWLFTLRGRLGYQTMLRLPSLFYFTGGMAMTQVKVSNSFNDNSSLVANGGGSAAQNQIGWTAGAGIEVITMDHVSLDFEYLYVNVPSVNTTGSITNTSAGFGTSAQSMTSPFSTTAHFYANVFKIGLNYRFDE